MVACPKNAFPAWEEQLGLCLPNDEVFVRLRGGNSAIQKALRKRPSKVLITYQQLPNVAELISAYMEGNRSFVFLDESHRIKRGFQGVIGNRILSFAELPDTKLIMSGTPMPNDIGDLVPQFRFLYPEVPADETSVEAYIKPVYVRTTKNELKLPEIKRTMVRIPMRPAQFELYELLRSEVARQTTKKSISIRDRMRLRKAGQSALRMLQVVSNPALLARAQFEHPTLLSEVLGEGDSPKLEYACLRARQLAYEEKKSIIWSSFVDNVELVSNRLLDLGAEFIHGGVDAGDENEEGTREQKVKRFHEDDNCFILVANPAACGEGISLHKVCHHAIYLDRNYNAAQYMQSEDRIHRLGLGPNDITYVEILVAPGTVDESVNHRLSLKIQNMARVLGDTSLNVEPEVVDLDSDGFNLDDFRDFIAHVSEKIPP
jgi:SNF2 family DNA or RNA helicase